MARQEQKRFIKRHMGHPSWQMTTTILTMIQQFNRYLPYLPGMENQFDADDVRKMVYNSLPKYIRTIITTSDYKCFKESKSDAEVCAYFDCLLVINALAQGKKRKSKFASKKQVTFSSKKKSCNKNNLNKNRLPSTRANVSNASSVI
jgi:hypothetical protein